MDENEKYKKYKALINLAIKNLHIYWKTNDEYQEYNDSGVDGIIKGIRTYDSSKGIKESTYVYACIENELKHRIYLNTMKKRTMKVVSLNKVVGLDGEEFGEFIPDDTNIEQIAYDNIMDEKILFYINHLKEKDREIIKYYWGIDNHPNLSFESIGKLYNNDKNAIRSRYLRSVRKIYLKLRSNDNEY